MTAITGSLPPSMALTALMVAVLARKNPLLVPVAACLLAYIRIGADVVNSKGDIPIEFITVIQGIVILMVAAEEFMGRYKKKLIYKAAEEELAAKGKGRKGIGRLKGKGGVINADTGLDR